MRVFNQYFIEVFSKNAINFIKTTRFRIIGWNSDSNIFKAIINGEIRDFEFYGHEDYPEIINMINSYYYKSKSVRKTIDYIQKRFARLLPQKSKPIKVTGKLVKCPECKQMMQISGNRPGTVCPNCGEGVLEII
jgi:hypothetical protein